MEMTEYLDMDEETIDRIQMGSLILEKWILVSGGQWWKLVV